ncbi:MAG: ABC transporter ATP-binding protein [Clostridiales bacterium]|nr:ABC transporter ATP-binding protein [Clostridiales bacterium]
MIQVEHISKKFGDFPVLKDISFCADEGAIYGLIGYNGVGKTTLMKIISGIYRPDAGTVRINGEPVYENASVKKQCFFMTEEATYFSQASLMQMRRFYRGYYENWSDRTFQGLIRLFGVDPNMKISRFSKGMQRQASLTLAFSTRAKYLFLDEAFDGLDFTMRRLMREMLIYYARTSRALLLVSSHNLRELEDLADRIGMISEGQLIFDDSTGHMKEQFSTCHFRMDDDREPSVPNARLIEREGEGYMCILDASEEESRQLLAEAGATDIRVRPIQLEEFFLQERKETSIDWKEIFA